MPPETIRERIDREMNERMDRGRGTTTGGDTDPFEGFFLREFGPIGAYSDDFIQALRKTWDAAVQWAR